MAKGSCQLHKDEPIGKGVPCKVLLNSVNGTTRGTINGIDISQALSIRFEHTGGQYPKMTVEFLVDELALDAETYIEQNSRTAGNGTAIRFTENPRFDR